MSSVIGKSASKLFREYKKAGGTLQFPAWVDREKEKVFSANGEDQGILPVDRQLNDSVHTAINDALKEAGFQTQESGKTVFGINKTVVVITSVVLLAGVVTLIVYHHSKP
jgi:hypothetical protein